MTPLDIIPARTALVALDFQDSTLGFLAEPGPLLHGARLSADATRVAGGRAAFVRVAFEETEVDAFPDHSAMGHRVRAAGSRMLANSPATAIRAELSPGSGDLILRKTRVGAFSTTPLHRELATQGVNTLVICGVHTSGAVLTTAREAHDLDYRVLVLRDACADPDDSIHAFLMDVILSRQAAVCSVEEYVTSTRRASGTSG